MRRKFKVVVDGETFMVEIEEIEGASEGESPSTGRPAATAHRPVERGGQVANEGVITAPLPGVISDVRVKVGDRVEGGAVLLVMEAMKMDNEIYAPIGGVVREIYVGAGQQVNRGDRLIHVS